MVPAGVVAYSAAAFLAALFLLESGTEKFIDHTAAVAQRTGISETVIGLLTAGGEVGRGKALPRWHLFPYLSFLEAGKCASTARRCRRIPGA